MVGGSVDVHRGENVEEIKSELPEGDRKATQRKPPCGCSGTF